jgi:type 1 fimbria pilin
MQFHKTPIAMAVVAACGAMPLAANAAPTISWTTPANSAVLSGTVSGNACAVTTSSDTQRVTFWADSWQINNDYSAPFNCNFPTT